VQKITTALISVSHYEGGSLLKGREKGTPSVLEDERDLNKQRVNFNWTGPSRSAEQYSGGEAIRARR